MVGNSTGLTPGIPASWIPHRRDDGEVVGWIDLDVAAPKLRPFDRLGRALPDVDQWDEAENALETRGLHFLAARFAWDDGVERVPVRIAELHTDRVVVSRALTDAVDDSAGRFEIPFPPPEGLRELE